MVKQLTKVLAALGVNTVPAAGWVLEGWSPGTMLAVYWFETMAASLLVAARIALHQRAAPRAGHFRYRPRATGTGQAPAAGGSYLAHFLTISVVFSLAHGFFLGVAAVLLTVNGYAAQAGLNWAEIRNGCGLVLALLLAGFAADVPGLRNRPFAWIERLGDATFGRVAVIHLTIILGMAAVAFTGADRALIGVFVVLKTMSDLALVLPQWDPERPPGWLCWAMDRVPNVQQGKKTGPKTFAEFWAADKAAERQRQQSNEVRVG